MGVNKTFAVSVQLLGAPHASSNTATVHFTWIALGKHVAMAHMAQTSAMTGSTHSRITKVPLKYQCASDSLKARIDLEACKQQGLAVEAYASRFKSIAGPIMVGCRVDRTTQAQWFLKELNGKIINELQGTVNYSVSMDVDTLVTAAVNGDATLDLGRQEYPNHNGVGKLSRDKGRLDAGQRSSQPERFSG